MSCAPLSCPPTCCGSSRPPSWSCSTIDVDADVLRRLIAGELPFLCARHAAATAHLPWPRALLAGSFNPLHSGHLDLAAAASRRLKLDVAFELTVFNADKPAIDVEEVRRRLRQFAADRAVWLTAGSTFVQKARCFPGAVFVVGSDTAERVLQPRFYGDEAARDVALKEIRDRGCRFLVAGRTIQGRFVTLDDLALSRDLHDLFEPLPESEFRSEASSTALRRS